MKRVRAEGLRITHPGGRVELLRNMGDHFLDEDGNRVENPTFAPGVKVEIVLPRIDARDDAEIS